MIFRAHNAQRYPEYYRWLVAERLPRATRAAALFVIGLNSFFFILDWWVYSSNLWAFGLTRIGWSASMAAVFVATRFLDPVLCVRLGCLVAGSFLIGISSLGGGVTSAYWPALLILFLGMPVLMPLTAVHAMGIVGALTALFAAEPLISGQAIEAQEYVVRVFFVVSAAIECVVSAAVLDRMRFADFCSRIEIEAARDHLREMDAAKSRFTSNVHHELRTPLTLILSPLAALQAGDYGPVPAALKATLQTMEVNGKRLRKLINNLLDLAKLEGHQFRVVREKMDLRQLVTDVVQGVKPHAERKGISVTMGGFECMPDLYADPDALDKVLVNLVGNALKFTDAGGRIEIWCGPLESGARIEVRDTGVGIPAEDLSRVFDRFAQVDGSTTRKFEGTGIGLSLAFELVDLHAGRIWAESEGVGRGTTVCVELPIGAADSVDEMEEAIAGGQTAASEFGDGLTDFSEIERSVSRYGDSQPSEGDFNPEVAPHAPSVVIADDNPDMRELLRFLLGRNYRVRTARNGREALELVRAELPHLVLTDLMMPEMSGAELCAAIKGDPSTEKIPVILVTSKADHEMKVTGLELGADDYVTKPFHPRELLARVRGFVRVRELQESLEERNGELENALSTVRETQSLLVASERRAAAGELAAGVAHEVNNPVNFALNAARAISHEVAELQSMARVRAGEDAEASREAKECMATILELAEIVSEGLGRTASLVGGLRDLATSESSDVEAVNLYACIEATIELIQPTYSQRDVEVGYIGAAEVPNVIAREGQLMQILLNLLKNGAESVGVNGFVRVDVVEEGDFVSVRVEDSGSGVSERDAARIFDPFYTTKGAGKGTGLGLSTSRNLAEEFGGSLQLVASQGRGAVFELVMRRA
ncbi:MAG: hypothetical protein CL931_09100 [Deltaproteobacteria bacterium]|nr:hypothetical protein [Deltaproteobacteria bacterium]